MVAAKNYETLFIVDAGLAEDAIAAIVEKFKSLIEKNGTVESVDEWGKRRLAYEIAHKNEGYYVLINFSTSDADFIAELERVFRITEGIMRSLVVAK